MRRGPRWLKNGGGPLSHGAGASVVPKRRRPPCPCGVGLPGPEMEETPRPYGGGVWMVAKRRRPPQPCGGGLGG